MFFRLSTQTDTRFTVQHQLTDSLWLSTDSGWHTYNLEDTTVIAKGYANECSLEDIRYTDLPTLRGNFCAFIIKDNKVTITHDTNRSFPVWVGENVISNLEPAGEPVWADCVLTVDNKFVVSRQQYKPWDIETSNMSDDDIVDNVHEILLETFDSFLSHNRLPLKMFVTGGIDTITAWAYLDHFTKDYEMVDYEYLKYTPFWKRNSDTVTRFWGYTQTHLWPEDCVLVSGAMGDENFMRGPHTMEMMLQAHGTNLLKVLQPGDYHYKYHIKAVDKGLDIGNVDSDINKVKAQVMDINTNDHQHWHIDRTLHFTPFKDSRIISNILKSSREQLILQARDAHINRLLIEKLDPNKLRKIGGSKNHDSMENM